MPSKLEIMAELERRGKLPEGKRVLLEEARRRGLVSDTAPAHPSNAVRDLPMPLAPSHEPSKPLPDLAVPAWIEGKAPILPKEISEPIVEGGGLVLGGIAGGAASGGNPAGIALGAGWGYSLAKRLSDIGHGRQLTAKEAMTEPVVDVAKGAAIEAGGQVAGKVIGAAVEKMAGPFTRRVSDEAADVLALAKEKGVKMSPADITQSRSVALGENVLSNAPLSAGIVQRFRLKQLQDLTKLRNDLITKKGSSEAIDHVGQKVQGAVDRFIREADLEKSANLNQIRDSLLKKMGSNETYEQIGIKTQAALSAKSKEMFQKASELYANVGKNLPEGTQLQTPNLRLAASEILEAELRKPASMQSKEIVKVLRDLSGNLDDESMQLLQSLPPDVRNKALMQIKNGYDWQTIQAIRSGLNDGIAAKDSALKTQAPETKFMSDAVGGVYKRLKKALDTDITMFSEQTGGEFKKSFDAATAAYKEGKQLFSKADMIRLLKKNPERIVDVIIKPGNVSEINMVRGAIGADGFNAIKQKFVSGMLDDATASGTFSPEKLKAIMDRYGSETLRTVFTPQELRLIGNMADDGLRLSKAPGTHRFYISLVKSLDKSPDKVVDLIIRPHNTKSIHMAKAALKDNWKDVEAKFIEKLVSVSKEVAGQSEEFISPAKFTTNVFKYGDDTLKAALSPESYKAVTDLAKLAKYTQGAERLAGNPSGTAQNIIAWSQGALVLHNPVIGTISAITPPALARLYLSEAGRRYLTTGIRTPAGTRQGTALATKILAIMEAEDGTEE